MSDFYVSSQTRQQILEKLHFAGDIKPLTVDFSVLADDTGTITSVTATIESGSAAIGTAVLASNVWTAPITTSQSGISMVKLVANSASYKEAIYIRITCKEPRAFADTTDYGMIRT